MIMYFRKILKISMNNDMTYSKPQLPPENTEHLVMDPKVSLLHCFNCVLCFLILFEIPLDMRFKLTAFLLCKLP